MKKITLLILGILLCSLLLSCGSKESALTMVDIKERMATLEDKGLLDYERDRDLDGWAYEIDEELERDGQAPLKEEIRLIYEIEDELGDDNYIFEFSSESDAKKGYKALSGWENESRYEEWDIRRISCIVIFGERETLDLILKIK
ncbi:MAG: hypothetical protein IJV96_03345 [Clostridia bacterium]|nr:hypothetical protein [Clostridia bacterium]